MYNLDQKIENYTEELFADLGMTAISEDQKADIFARLQEQFHKVILRTLSPVARQKDAAGIQAALEQEDYAALDKILKRYPQHRVSLEEKIQQEFDQIKLSLAEEQKHDGETKVTGDVAGGGAEPAAGIERGV